VTGTSVTVADTGPVNKPLDTGCRGNPLGKLTDNN